jgi:hypothetical protein
MTNLTPFFQTLATVSATFCGFLIVALVWIVGRSLDSKVEFDDFDKKRYEDTRGYLISCVFILALCSASAVLGTYLSTISTIVNLVTLTYAGLSFLLAGVGIGAALRAMLSFARERNPKPKWWRQGGFIKPDIREKEDKRL